MSPTANLRPYTQPCENMSNSSMDICHNNLGDLLPMLGGYSKHRSILVQYDSKFKLTENLRRMMDGLCDVKFTEMERTSYASQISENAMESYLIGMGSYDQVIDKLNESISEVLSYSDLCLPYLFSSLLVIKRTYNNITSQKYMLFLIVN